MRHRRTLAGPLLGALLLAAPAVLGAQEGPPPSPEDVLGYPLGAHFSDHASVLEYARALADASPLVEYRDYGRTVEGRELAQLVVGRADHLARLDQLLALNAELARGADAERAAGIAASNPAVVYLSYGIHGNEASSSEAAMWTAWDLARGAEEAAGVLDSLVVVIDPVANPDGRDRYVQWYRSVRGARPDPNPQTREHREPWPGGRFNHYLFDLNRDWAWMSQPETRARLATWDTWNPQVHVDFHEMSPNSTYFFFPASAPINPIYPPYVFDWWERFGAGNAAAFDARGWPYYTRENYDMLYPGYGDTWPTLLGAIGMTYEQAGGGAAGLAYRREAGDTLTLADRATHHRTSGLATLRTAAGSRTRLLLDFAAAVRTAGSGEPDVLLVPGADTTRVRQLALHLRRQGIDVERAAAPFSADAEAYPGHAARREFPPGTYLVRMRQPRGRLAATLLQPETELRAEHSYDISAWSLPYAFGVEAHRLRGAPRAPWAAVDTAAAPAALPPAPGYGYLVRPNEESARGIVRLLRAGGRVRTLTREATFAGAAYPPGTWFIPAAGDPQVRDRVAAAGLGPVADPVPGGRSQEGVDLGSEHVRPVRLPRVALLGGEGVVPTSYGAHWFFLEQGLDLPFDALLVADVPRVDLDEYDVLVLPEAQPDRLLPDAARAAIEAWVRDGGRLVAVGSGAEIAARLDSVPLRMEREEDAGDRLLRTRRQREQSDWQDQVPGVILELLVDPGHPLAWGAAPDGIPDRVFVLHEGMRVFEPTADVEVVAHFAAGLDATSGIVSEANLERLERGAWLVSKTVGAGRLVLFAGDPLFRLFWRSTYPLYVNALLVGDL